MKRDQTQLEFLSPSQISALHRLLPILLLGISIFTYHHTIAGEIAPEWAKDAVWYQIFPERFANGDLSNDPTLQDIVGAWPHDTTSNWNLHPWISDWYELQPWEQENSQGFYFNVQRRRYGGDLQGIINRLPYLADLGINALF